MKKRSSAQQVPCELTMRRLHSVNPRLTDSSDKWNFFALPLAVTHDLHGGALHISG
jgi:hypothetical protein